MILDEQNAIYQEQQLKMISDEEVEDRNERIKSLYQARKLLEISDASKTFLNSKIGRFILDRAIADQDDAKNKLVDVRRSDFDDTTSFLLEINDLQHRAEIPGLIMSWIEGSILAAEEEENIQREKEILDEGNY